MTDTQTPAAEYDRVLDDPHCGTPPLADAATLAALRDLRGEIVVPIHRLRALGGRYGVGGREFARAFDVLETGLILLEAAIKDARNLALDLGPEENG